MRLELAQGNLASSEFPSGVMAVLYDWAMIGADRAAGLRAGPHFDISFVAESR
jgi:hypothetical protein